MLLTQKQMLDIFLPLLNEKGQLYSKFRHVIARVSDGKERIVSTTSAGEETVNTTEAGDFVVQNQTTAKEWYVIKPQKFKQRYEKARDLQDGFAEYHPIGQVIALQMTQPLLTALGLKASFHFEAPWGEAQVALAGDYIVTPPDQSEVYRIGQPEFLDTYRLSQ